MELTMQSEAFANPHCKYVLNVKSNEKAKNNCTVKNKFSVLEFVDETDMARVICRRLR